MLIQAYVCLAMAIVSGVIGTAALKAAAGFTPRYALAADPDRLGHFGLFLSVTLKALPIGIAYAIWSGLGIIFVALVGLFRLRQPLDLPAVIGLGLIVAAW